MDRGEKSIIYFDPDDVRAIGGQVIFLKNGGTLVMTPDMIPTVCNLIDLAMKEATQ